MRQLALGLALAALPTSDTVQPPTRPRMVLAEVLFDPTEGDTAFVELLNVGNAAADLTEFVLQVDTTEMPLPRLEAPLAPGASVVVRFDGGGTTEGRVIHAGGEFALDSAGGVISLLSNTELVLDRVAWGSRAGAVVPTFGGMGVSARERGSSFGRPPGANRAGASWEWVLYPPAQVTPGAANPLPAVSQLLPVHGAILEQTTIELSWYPVPGATSYRVQLATDTGFARPLLNQTVARPSVSSGQRAAGAYWWRVQALAEGSPPAAWSVPSFLELGVPEDGGDDREMPEPAGRLIGGPSHEDVGSSGRAANSLGVAMLYQHKDSKMLHLESVQEGRPRTAWELPTVPHAWDRDHGTLDPDDEADAMNCALASVAMINKFYQGDLTQDRIGYEVRSRNILRYRAILQQGSFAARLRHLGAHVSQMREDAPGPERDLNYGAGLAQERVISAIYFALGTLPGPRSGFLASAGGGLTLDSLWNTVVAEIDAGRPLFAATRGHALVIRGYSRPSNRRLIAVNDPWFGPYRMDIDHPTPVNIRGYIRGNPIAMIHTIAKPARATRQEPSVSTDSDGDGVVDFDETERFFTDPQKKDTDADGVEDKPDIASGVYEIEYPHGYAFDPAHGLGRDYDGDGKATELDYDSDGGGCKDGDEDTSGDGERNGTESDNFDLTDDDCQALDGSVSYEIHAVNQDPTQIIRMIYDAATILVRLKRVPGEPLAYMDDSSTFTYRGAARVEVVAGPRCVIWGREAASASRHTFAGGGVIGARRGGGGTNIVSLGASYDVPSRTRSAGCGGAPGGQFGERTMNFPDCQGLLTAYPGGRQQYEFDCTVPPNLGPGWKILSYYARGHLRLR